MLRKNPNNRRYIKKNVKLKYFKEYIELNNNINIGK